MEKDVAAALEYWREVNANPNKWASLECIQFTYDRVVRVDYGRRFSDGRKEIAIATRNFRVDTDGNVRWYDAVHP